MITVLIVDDEPEIIRVARGYLEQGGYAVLAARDGTTALEIVRRERPDLIVLDLNLPTPPGLSPLDGIDVARQVRQMAGAAAQTPIIMLTARVDETDRIVGLEVGADDYMPKPFSPRELVARVRAVLRRSARPAATPEQIAAGPLVIDVTRHVVKVDDQVVDLTPTEFALLQAMAAEPGRAWTRSQLIDLLGSDYEGLDRTVDSHIKNLRAKIEPNPNQPRFVLTVFGVGYKFNDTF